MTNWLYLAPDAYLQRRRRERRLKLVAAVLLRLAAVATFVWVLP